MLTLILVPVLYHAILEKIGGIENLVVSFQESISWLPDFSWIAFWSSDVLYIVII